MKFIFLILKEFTETYVSYVSKYFRIGGLLINLEKVKKNDKNKIVKYLFETNSFAIV